MAAVEIRVGDDGATRHLVEGNVLGVQIRRAGHHHGMAHALGIAQRPGQGLHAAQAAAQHGGEPLDAQAVQQTRLRIHPVLHRHHGKIRTIGLARGRVGVHGAGRAEAGAQIVDADDKELVGIDGLARADHVVPPAFALGLALVAAGYMVGGIERMTDHDGVALVGIELAIGLEGKIVIGDGTTALQGQRLIKMHELRCRDEGHMKKPGIAKNEAGSVYCHFADGSLAGFIKRPQALANRRVKNTVYCIHCTELKRRLSKLSKPFEPCANSYAFGSFTLWSGAPPHPAPGRSRRTHGESS